MRKTNNKRQHKKVVVREQQITNYVPYIPDEIIFHIATYLPGNNIYKLLLSSKRFAELLDVDNLWQERTQKEFLTTNRRFLSPYFDSDFADDDDEDDEPPMKVHEERIPFYFSAKERYVMRFMDAKHRCSFCYCTLDMEHSHFIDYFAACSTCRQTHLLTEKDMKLKYALNEQEINLKIKKINGSSIFSFTREVTNYLKDFRGGVEAEVSRRKAVIDNLAKKKGLKISHNESRWRYKYYVRLMREGVPAAKSSAIANNTIYRQQYLRKDKMDALVQERVYKYKWNHKMYDYFQKVSKRKPEHNERAQIRIHTASLYSQNPETTDITNELKKIMKDLNRRHVDKGKLQKELDKKVSKATNKLYTKVSDLPFRIKKRIEDAISTFASIENFDWDQFISSLKLVERARREEEFKKEMEKAGYNYTVANLPNEAISYLDGKNDYTHHQAVTASMIDFQSKFRLGSAVKHTKAPKSIRSLTTETKEDLSTMYLETLFKNFAKANEEDEESDYTESEDKRGKRVVKRNEEADEPNYYRLEWTKEQKSNFSSEFCNLIAKIDPKMAIHFMRSKAFVDMNKNEMDIEEDDTESSDDIFAQCQTSTSRAATSSNASSDDDSSSRQERNECTYNLRKRRRTLDPNSIENDSQEAIPLTKKSKK